MNYEQWSNHTTELQNEHGYKGKAKPAGPLAKISVYEFVNDWLPPQLAWQIFSYAAEPHGRSFLRKNGTKQLIADHYNGIGQRYWQPSGRTMRHGHWGNTERAGWRGRYDNNRLPKYSERCVALTNKFNRNLIVEFLTSVRKREPMRYDCNWPCWAEDLAMRCPKQSVNVNKVKGRTKLIKNYIKRFKLDPDEEFALYNQFVADDGYTLSFTQHIAIKKMLHDEEKAAASLAMCQAIQAI